MINISFYLLSPKAKNYTSLYVSLTQKDLRERFPTGEKLPAEYCNQRKKKGKDLVKKNTAFYFDLDTKLKKLKEYFVRLQFDLEAKGVTPTPAEIKKEYLRRKEEENNKPDIFKAYDDFLNSFRAKNEWGPSTVKIYNTLKNNLTALEEFRGNKIEFNEINEEFWEEVRSYFAYQKNYSNSSSNKYLSSLKPFLRYLEKKELIKKLDFDELPYFEELKGEDLGLLALTEQELESITNLDLSTNPRLEKVRDIFIIECLTSQRFEDLENVLDLDKHTANQITIFQNKTNSRVEIPITGKLRSFLAVIKERYKGKELKVLSNQKFNSYIKEVAKEAKINTKIETLTLKGKKKIKETFPKWQLITSHTGRRTFCTIALQKGIPPEFIMKVTGHKDYNTFKKYLRIEKEETFKQFLEKF